MEKKRENERKKDMSRGKKCASLVVELFALKRQRRLMSSGGASSSSSYSSYSSRIISSSFASSSFQNLAREGSCFRGKWSRELQNFARGGTGRAFSTAATPVQNEHVHAPLRLNLSFDSGHFSMTGALSPYNIQCLSCVASPARSSRKFRRLWRRRSTSKSGRLWNSTDSS